MNTKPKAAMTNFNFPLVWTIWSYFNRKIHSFKFKGQKITGKPNLKLATEWWT